MATNSDTLFLRLAEQICGEARVATKAIECVEAFTERFNARDLAGMDAMLHFPHALVSGKELNELIVWEQPGQMSASFFDDLTAATGWYRTTYLHKQVILASAHKVHLLIEYTRDDAAGKVITSHQNLWIVTFEDGRWGIKVRSH
jgi:hypothetical protein